MAYRDNVEITEESYVPGGLGVEDYLIPNKPHIDWDTGVSYAGGFSQPAPQTAGRGFAGENINPDDIDLDDVKSARKRRSGFANAMMTVADLLKISASMPNVYGQSALQPGSAYLGMTEEEANKRAKARMEEDPEGKEIDINRAKVLSQRASETDDPELKKKYGRAIKQLLPRETQGLDDITASTFLFNQSDKLQQQLLKNAGNLAVQREKNSGNVTTTGMKTDSNERIAAARNATQMQIHELDNAVKQAIQEGKNDIALQLMDRKADLQTSLHIMDNEADYARELMKQQHADYRTVYGQDAATNRTQMQQEGAMNRTVYSQDAATQRTQMTQEGANARNEANNKRALAVAMMKPIGGTGAGGGKGTAKEREAAEQLAFRMENWDDYIAKQDADIRVLDDAIKTLKENPSATGFMTHLGMRLGGAGVYPKTEKAYGTINEKTTQMVMEIIKQLNAAGATSSVFNSPAEQEKIIGTIMDPTAPYNARLAAFESFRDRLQRFYDQDRKMTAWKAQRAGYQVGGRQVEQAAHPQVVTANQVNSNRKVVEGGVEW